jgi:hypothetical protein
MEKAARLEGKCINVGVVCWFLAGLNGKRKFSLEYKWLLKFSVGRGSSRRCLKKLEDAGLLSVERHVGRSPIVTILTDENRDAGLRG